MPQFIHIQFHKITCISTYPSPRFRSFCFGQYTIRYNRVGETESPLSHHQYVPFGMLLYFCGLDSFMFRLYPLSEIHKDIHSSCTFYCSALRHFFCLLWLLLTFQSSWLLRLMQPPVRSRGINPEPFAVYLPDLHIKVTVAF